MSNINYVFGNTIRIYRLPNIGDKIKNETYLNSVSTNISNRVFYVDRFIPYEV